MTAFCRPITDLATCGRAFNVCLQIFEGIRDFIVQSVELKFNCFFLMPLIDTFPQVGAAAIQLAGA